MEENLHVAYVFGSVQRRVHWLANNTAIATSNCGFDLFEVDPACFRYPNRHPGANAARLAFGYSGWLDLKPDRRASKEADNEICHFMARASGSIRKRLRIRA